MMTARRIDYLDDPDAPEPNSLVPSANVIVINDDGAILLIRRTDNGNLALPGGGMDLGESITQAAVREVKEETGLDVKITGLVGIYTNPNHLIEYTSDGEVRQEFSVVFTAKPRGGAPTTSSEASEVIWADPADVPGMKMHPSMRQRIDHFRQARSEPYLG
jgi:ADP-ribose pyrophosphatase YjhB (NUDIX family)